MSGTRSESVQANKSRSVGAGRGPPGPAGAAHRASSYVEVAAAGGCHLRTRITSVAAGHAASAAVAAGRVDTDSDLRALTRSTMFRFRDVASRAGTAIAGEGSGISEVFSLPRSSIVMTKLAEGAARA
jgi:hypothetical protein